MFKTVDFDDKIAQSFVINIHFNAARANTKNLFYSKLYTPYRFKNDKILDPSEIYVLLLFETLKKTHAIMLGKTLPFCT